MKKNEFLDLIHFFGKTKSMKRSGWKRYSIDDSESLAEHTFRLSLIVLLFCFINKKLDMNKMLKMALIHDLPEIITGDITPRDNFSKDEKKNLERNALLEIFGDIPEFSGLIELWDEFENKDSIEAEYLKDLDKLEMVIQAVDYKKLFPKLRLNEFIDYAEKQITSKEVETLFKIEKIYYKTL